MANPNGVNSFDRFGSEPVQGAVKRLTQLTQSAPISGAARPALNAPRRAQRHAAGKDTPRGENAVAPMPPPELLAPPVDVPGFWRSVAAHPDASPVVRDLANRVG